VSTNPLIVLGFDVGDPDSLLKAVREGRLPTLASILARGTWGRTTGRPDLINEHSVWVSLLSGVPMSRHGFFYYRRLKPGTYELETITGRAAAARPFWAYATKRRVAVIDPPHFYPEPGMKGIHLSEWASHHPSFPPMASPPNLLDTAHRVFGPQIRIPEELETSLEDDRRIYERTLLRLERNGVLCRHLLEGDAFDAVVIVFADSHLANHQFWEYRPEHAGRRKLDPRGVLDRAILEVYERIDREMGSLLERLPSDSNVCIVSSTGILDHYPTTGLIEGFCRTLGYQASPPATSRVRPLSLLRRFLPERLRYALSSRLPESTQQRLMQDKFRGGTDWSRTTAFSIPSFFTSFIRVNLKGREPDGIVDPGPDYDALLDRVEDDLRRLADPASGKPLVKEIFRVSSLHDGAPPDLLPDLFVEWEPHTSYLERAMHPRAEIVAYPPEIWRGNDHSRSGLVALAGPSIRWKGPMGEVSILDLAPTFLALMGEPPAREMPGSPLPIFDPPER
jgi:predicted AlkP superfamily phosphohydrolase/phosphomutase